MTRRKQATIDIGALRAAMATVIGAVERRNTIPILGNVALLFEPGAVTVRATDLDMQIDRRVPCDDVQASWAITAPAHVVKAVVDKMASDQQAVLSFDGGKLAVVSGRSKVHVATLPIEDFPELARDEWAAEFEVSGAELTAMIAHCKGAVSTEETRYCLNGVLMQRSEAMLLLVSSDGHRLAKAERAAPDGSEALGIGGDLGEGVIIPRKALPLIEALARESRVGIAVSRGKLRVDAGESTLVTKLVDGQFPNWRRVVPSHEHRALFHPQRLADAVDRVAAVSTDKTRAVRIALAEDVATLTVVCPETGEASEEVETDYDGPPITLGLNAAYLRELLTRFPGEEVSMAVGDDRSPVLCRASADAADLRVCMLMRV